MSIVTKSISYSYDDADIIWWAAAYGCPEEVEDKEAWATEYVKKALADVLANPYKTQLRQQTESSLIAIDQSILSRMSVE